MRTVDIIKKKRDGNRLCTEELKFLIDGYVKRHIPDYQISALLMAIYLRGMDDEETAILTEVMVQSGTTIDLTKICGYTVDKHSTGGVGDKTTLVLAPLVAAAGLVMAKLSGRSLGHTGGTIDKLESIPGLRTDLSTEEFLQSAQRCGLVIANHSADVVPADQLFYKLRDVTATIESLPLIVSSIMSKKIAGGARAIVIDVKTGSGAFLSNIDQSRRLAQSLVAIGKRLDRRITALITNMSQPLGRMVGNALEVREAIATLKGEGPSDLEELCCQLGAELLIFAGQVTDRSVGANQLRQLLYNGAALSKFRAMIIEQNGDPAVINNSSLLPIANKKVEILAPSTGYVKQIDALSIGQAANLLGAGRAVKTDRIDAAVGIELCAKINDRVSAGEILAILHVNDEANLDRAYALVKDAYQFAPVKQEAPPLVLERVE
ncbi:thymidine phosphorylase [Candidatus Acetothermia bacterium]|nr:thymidine phosphorylase [Candidatus Acetothermia bacterium]